MSAFLPDRIEQLTFLINNYEIMSNAISDNEKLFQETNRFKKFADEYIQDFCHEQLEQNFRNLLNFSENSKNAAKIAGDYNLLKESKLEAIRTFTLKSFPNYETGEKIQKCLTEQLKALSAKFSSFFPEHKIE